jgi:hypothetical protein
LTSSLGFWEGRLGVRITQCPCLGKRGGGEGDVRVDGGNSE